MEDVDELFIKRVEDSRSGLVSLWCGWSIDHSLLFFFAKNTIYIMRERLGGENRLARSGLKITSIYIGSNGINKQASTNAYVE